MAKKYTYHKTIYNDYLGESKVVKACTFGELSAKVDDQLKKWEIKETKAREKDRIDDLKDEAEFDTHEALTLIQEYRNILTHTLSIDDKLNWNSQKDFRKYKPFELSKPTIEEMSNLLHVPKQGFLETVFKSKRLKREELEKNAKDLLAENLIEYDNALKKYDDKKSKFLLKQEAKNKEIDEWKAAFEMGDKEAIERYIDVILGNSSYPEGINQDYEVEYNSDNKILVVSFYLPNPDEVPKIIEYKYVKSRDQIDTKEMKKTEFEKFYEDIIYQITLRTIHEIFESLYFPHVDTIVFNGWVQYTDPATGKDVTSCIISLQTNREEFLDINLEKVDVKECIKSLKGLFAGKLISLAPVKPFLNISTEDKRFVEDKDILSELNSSSNLASMPWEDFEHLVRQLFEKMFSSSGSEVKVTQASRDGGVDAIAFDSDPIKGGKFVIQAKRYNNVVSVSSVRDLYGTMIHEGATKGILVTTSYFGNDSYNFIKDKPISLIDGNNLLSLFNQHGYDNLNITLKAK